MTIVFNTLFSPAYQQNPLVTPLLKFHSKTISLWNNLSKESPVYKMATRALIAVVAPFGYLALGLVALVGWALNSKLQGKAIHVKKSGDEDSIEEPDDKTKEVEDGEKSEKAIETDTQYPEGSFGKEVERIYQKVKQQEDVIFKLNFNGLSVDTIERFLKNWSPKCHYKELDFSQTSISDYHLILIGQILTTDATLKKTDTTLKKLVFNDNKNISLLGITNLISCLSCNHTLQTIEMKKMSFSHENLAEKLSSEILPLFNKAKMNVEGSSLKITYKPHNSDQYHTLILKSEKTIEKTDTQDPEKASPTEEIKRKDSDIIERFTFKGMSSVKSAQILGNWKAYNYLDKYKELDFSEASIRDDHLKLMPVILVEDTTLKKLVFNGNQDISLLGITNLIKSLGGNHTLQTIEMKEMSFSHENLAEKLSSEILTLFTKAKMKVEGSNLTITYIPLPLSRKSDDYHTLTLVC